MRFLVTILFFVAFTYLSFGQCSHKHHRLSSYFSEENLRSDTIDVLHYDIYLDLSNMASAELSANSVVNFQAKMSGVTSLTLDLEGLTVDSVIYNNQQVAFIQQDSIMRISFPNNLSTNTSESVKVYYHGSPIIDPSGWGGGYYSGGYAFNLGVGFDSKPHNYGRTWHPCFDNFVERVAYSIAIETSPSNMGTSIGNLTDTTHLTNGNIRWNWEMTESIPSYLSMFAVSNYSEVKSIHQGINNAIPISLFARSSDTNNLKQSFIHLPNAIQAFEKSFGPYQFNKVGYSLVPFNGGAMEHATNITYPLSSANGNLSSETLMAHELGHSWWGNWVTCETPEDMWLNEGWASYSAILFLESVYGWERAVKEMNNTLFPVISRAHITEGGFLAVSGLPHELTYGTHTYDKGALVAWNLRGYLGDSLFFDGIKSFLNQHAFSTMNSEEFRDDLSQITGVDLTPFFDGWVFQGGYPAVELNEFSVAANNEVSVEIEQKLRGIDTYFTAMPVELLFTNQQGDSTYRNIAVNGHITTDSYTLPFEPTEVHVNPNRKLALAHTEVNQEVTSTGIISSNDVLIQSLQANTVNAAGKLHVELYWVRADDVKDYNTKAFKVSKDRYWKVNRSTASEFNLSATILFDAGNSGGFLDSALLLNYPEDSLVLLYRPNQSYDWEVYENVMFNNLGNPNDGRAVAQINLLIDGEYTLGARDQAVLGVEQNNHFESFLTVFPNPTSGETTIKLNNENIKTVTCYSIDGKNVYTSTVNSQSSTIPTLPTGNYIIQVETETGKKYKSTLVAQ